MGRQSRLAKEIAELDGPIAKDFDPEEIPRVQNDESASEQSEDELAGTEHYIEVGKSQLRKPAEVALGPQYVGAKISREELFNDEDEKGSEDEDDDTGAPLNNGGVNSGSKRSTNSKSNGSSTKGKLETSNGIKRPTAADFMSDSDQENNGEQKDSENEPGDEIDDDSADESDEDLLQHSELPDGEYSGEEEEEEDDDDDDDNGSNGIDDSEEEDEDDSADSSGSDGEDEKTRRAELRKIMNEEQKTVVATISQAAKADAEKGKAVNQQRKTFDSFLNVRIRLQKALVATNSMAATETKDIQGDVEEQYKAAEDAAIKLWNTLDSIRSELSKISDGSRAGQKRKFTMDTSTAITEVWENMQASEASSIDLRQKTLEKWSSKAKGTTALPLSRKLNPTAAFQQSITAVLQDQLADPEHLVKKTRMPRSCAPVQAKLKVTEDAAIYDDADFYQLLLKELIDQRMVDSASSAAVNGSGRPMQWAAVKEAKTKKVVDTKASKGRKLRYTVHEKLQNFMAPENRGTWERDAIDRFFGTLLGQKMTLGEDEEASEEEELPLEEEGLMLFRS
ncbi:apoptosis-antagonizing transcription factor [Xylogone sp. PMI_703]|nr:apoptosis-antagonizing transcription factor [Xylogone sp. PMI_703]